MNQFIPGKYKLEIRKGDEVIAVVAEAVLNTQEEGTKWYQEQTFMHSLKLQEGCEWFVAPVTDPVVDVAPVTTPSDDIPFHVIAEYEKQKFIQENKQNCEVQDQFLKYVANFTPSNLKR